MMSTELLIAQRHPTNTRSRHTSRQKTIRTLCNKQAHNYRNIQSYKPNSTKPRSTSWNRKRDRTKNKQASHTFQEPHMLNTSFTSFLRHCQETFSATRVRLPLFSFLCSFGCLVRCFLAGIFVVRRGCA